MRKIIGKQWVEQFMVSGRLKTLSPLIRTAGLENEPALSIGENLLTGCHARGLANIGNIMPGAVTACSRKLPTTMLHNWFAIVPPLNEAAYL